MNRHSIPLACIAITLAATAARAGEPRGINESRPADPAGSVEIVNVAGSVDVQGWDQPQLEVTGTIGDKVERVDVTSSGKHASVRVVLPSGSHWGGGGSADLTVHVPRGSALTVSLVSADLQVAELAGDGHLSTVSGNISGALDGDAHVNTVSGDVQLKAPAARDLEVKTISGNVSLYGAGGNVQVSTVSGDAELSLGVLDRGRFETVSGDFGIGSTLAAGGQIDAESVSGDIMLSFAAAPDAAIDLQSFSGDIDNCFGPKPVTAEYGPGSRLMFNSGNGAGRLHVDTKSGDISLCTKTPRPPKEPKASMAPKPLKPVAPPEAPEPPQAPSP
jgi:hypothetical protein